MSIRKADKIVHQTQGGVARKVKWLVGISGVLLLISTFVSYSRYQNLLQWYEGVQKVYVTHGKEVKVLKGEAMKEKIRRDYQLVFWTGLGGALVLFACFFVLVYFDRVTLPSTIENTKEEGDGVEQANGQ